MIENSGLQFHHIGIAVKNQNFASSFLSGLGYQIGAQVYDPLQKVNLIMCSHAVQPCIELVFMADEEGPLAKILESRNELMYHVCYETDDLAQSLQKLERSCRYICVSPPKPAILFGNKLVSFYMVRGFGLIEILEANSCPK